MFAVIAIMLHFAQAVEPETKLDAETQAKIKKLMTERRDTLKKVVTGRMAEFLAGRTTVEDIARYSKELLKAELDLATKQAERRAAYAAYLKVAKEVEKQTRNRFEAGRASESDYNATKAARLEGEIGYLKAGGKDKKDK